MRLFLTLLLSLTLLGPLIVFIAHPIDFRADWKTANRESAHLAPLPHQTTEAIVQVYSARAFNWRGLFATHTWIATKAKNANHYIVYQVIGWRLLRNLPPLLVTADLPDRYWFNQKPHVILDLRGEKAEKIIPQIEKAAKTYPYAREYVTWPGPNSNTFTAYIARQVPEMQLTLPSNAVGKDYLGNTIFLSKTPSGTGYQFSFYGILGITIAKAEGLEINLLGLVYGLNPMTMTLKLPGLGDVKI